MLEEPHIPFEYEVLYEDENIIVVDKPHFLATTPRGMWYRETALVRLCERYDEPNITPAHRLDRLTAGVVVFVRNPSARGAYQMLFQNRKTVKTYECLAPLAPTQRPRSLLICDLRTSGNGRCRSMCTAVPYRGRCVGASGARHS